MKKRKFDFYTIEKYKKFRSTLLVPQLREVIHNNTFFLRGGAMGRLRQIYLDHVRATAYIMIKGGANH